MNSGYILLWRKLYETSFYKDSYALHLAIHLLLKANHETKHIVFNQQPITIERGQCICGRSTLSEETGMKPSTIRNKLEKLRKTGFLTSTTTNKFSLITIAKYDGFQRRKGDSAKTDQQEGQLEGQQDKDDNQQKQDSQKDSKQDNQRTAEGQQEDTNNECNALNTSKDKEIYILAFEEIWKRYPNKDGRKAAERHFSATVKTPEQISQINKALDNYLQHLQKEDWKRPKNGSTWFNNWQDWINNPIEKEKSNATTCKTYSQNADELGRESRER